MRARAGEQLRKGVHVVEGERAEVPPFFDTFDEWRGFCLGYRNALGKVARLTASLLPEPALAAASRRLANALQTCTPSSSGAGLAVRTPRRPETLRMLAAWKARGWPSASPFGMRSAPFAVPVCSLGVARRRAVQ